MGSLSELGKVYNLGPECVYRYLKSEFIQREINCQNVSIFDTIWEKILLPACIKSAISKSLK